MTALRKLDARWQAGARICVGLDSRYSDLPSFFRTNGPYLGIKAFNREIIRATKDKALAYKMNRGPYVRSGLDGMRALIDTFEFIRDEAPDVLDILDTKDGDALAEINDDYAHFAFEQCGADAMTAQVYAGGDAAEGFTRYADKLIFFLCKTSNEGSGDFQHLYLDPELHDPDGLPLYQYLATTVNERWNANNNCGLVVGATHPDQMKEIRNLVDDMPILSPGSGTQGGDFEKTIRAGVIPKLGRLIMSESRSIIFASKKADFTKTARDRLLERTAEYNKILELEAV